MNIYVYITYNKESNTLIYNGDLYHQRESVRTYLRFSLYVHVPIKYSILTKFGSNHVSHIIYR